MKIYIQLFLMIGLLFLVQSCSFTTANFKDLATASAIDSNNQPVTIVSEFSPTTPTIYVTGVIANAASNTMIKAEWIFLDTDPITVITDYSILINDTTVNFYFELSKPTNNWPVGQYEVRLYIDDVLKDTVTFTVK